MKSIDFSEFEGIRHPFELYKDIYPKLVATKSILYATGPITSGRLRDENPDLSTRDIIALNKTFAFALLELINRLKERETTVVLPHQLGRLEFPSQNGDHFFWGEREYLSFWMMVITRIAPQLASQLWNQIENFFSRESDLNKYHASRKDRINHYLALEKTVLSFLAEHDYKNGSEKNTQLLSLPDSKLSLGSTLEKRVAKAIGIPIFEIIMNPYLIEKEFPNIAKDPVYQQLLELNVLATLNNPNLIATLIPILSEFDYQV